MNLLQLRTEALAHGFDPIQYGSRITQYINDANQQIASEVDYYADEQVQVLTTVVGSDTYPWPQDMGEIRSVFDTGRFVELQYASLRDFDRSNETVQGAPIYWTTSGLNVKLYPVPDSTYTLDVRYWSLPPTLVNDTDTPPLPAQWHKLLWIYAVWQCYEGDDDAQMGQYWEGRWNRTLSEAKADLKFPTSDGPSQASSMWDQRGGLTSGTSWTY